MTGAWIAVIIGFVICIATPIVLAFYARSKDHDA